MSFYCFACLGYVQGNFPPDIACKPKGVNRCTNCGRRRIGIYMDKEVRDGKKQSRGKTKKAH